MRTKVEIKKEEPKQLPKVGETFIIHGCDREVFIRTGEEGGSTIEYVSLHSGRFFHTITQSIQDQGFSIVYQVGDFLFTTL